MSFRFERRNLARNGKCICCGKEIKANREKVTVFSPHKSQVYQVTICDSCAIEMTENINTDVMKEEENNHENND